MDDIDRQLIALLRSNARASVASLAKALGVSRGTVQNRMARLQATGAIVGYTVRLKPDVEEHRIRALMTIDMPRRSATSRAAAILAHCSSIPNRGVSMWP